MTMFKRITASLLVAGALLPFFAQDGRAQTPSAPNAPEVHVYLMRGLFGVFSLGMDDLAEKLRAYGYRADVYAWTDWSLIADQIANNYGRGHRGPVAVIGHSLGANSTIEVANNLSQKPVPIALGVTFDATEPGTIPPNVLHFMNFYALDGFGHKVEPSPAFAGELINLDLTAADGSITHTNIDALDRFHVMVIGKLVEVTAKHK
jgi:hypothetical protein